MTNIKLAATIMLARYYKGTLEVLLLRRNKALAFAGGLWVFPGGKIEEKEIEASENDLAAAKLAAVRETEEEANLKVDPDNLIFFRHWTTPIVEPRRYATWFFFAGVEADSFEVKIDDSEIKEHLWIAPQDALDKFRLKELAMMPPTIMSLQLIRKCKSVKEVRSLLQKEEVIYILPVLKRQDKDMICMYKGDAGYDTADPNLPGARHRMILDIKGGDFKFEFQDCEGVRPVNGGMHL